MKKFRLAMIIAAVFAVVLGSFTFTGCDMPLIAEENTWYSTKKEVSGTTFKFYFYYTQEEAKAGDVTLDPGITVLVTPSSSPLKIYAMKTFGKSENSDIAEVEDEPVEGEEAPAEDEEKVSFKVGGTTMDALYLFYKNDFRKSETPKAPSLLDKDEGYTTVENIKDLGKQLGLEDLTWKKIVKEVINAVL